MTFDDFLKKEVMPIGKSRRDLRHEGIYSFIVRERISSTLEKRLVLSEAKEVSQVVPEGKERVPWPRGRGGLPNLYLSPVYRILRHEGIRSFILRERTPSALKNVIASRRRGNPRRNCFPRR